MDPRDILSEIRALHKKWLESGLVLSIAFPWNGGEVVEFAADRNGSVMGLREFFVLSDLPVQHRASFLELLQGGAVVESLSIFKPEPAPPPRAPKRKTRRVIT